MTRWAKIVLLLFFVVLGTYAVPSLRLIGFPIPVLLAPILFLIWISQNFRKETVSYLLCFIALLIGVILFSFCFSSSKNLGYTITLILFLLIFYLLSNYISKTIVSTKLLLNIIFVNGMLIFLYGLYGFFNWNIGDFNQHLLGYYGVTYLVSTRNGDIAYLFTPFLFALIQLTVVKNNPVYLKIFYWICFLAVAAGVVFSFARGAWIALTLSIILLACFTGFKYRYAFKSIFKLGLLFTAGFVIVLYSVPEEVRAAVFERFISIFEPDQSSALASNDARMDLYYKAWNIFLNAPLIGVGPGSTSHFLTYFDGSAANHAESLFLTVLIELGLVGLSIYLVFLGYYCMLFSRKIKGNYTSYDLFSLLLFFSFNCYGIFNLMIDSLWYWSMMGLAYGLILSKYKGTAT